MGIERFRRSIIFAGGMADPVSVFCGLSVALTAAQLAGMFAAPVNILPARSGSVLIIDHVTFQMTPGSVAFTGGGAVQFQYHTAPNAVGHQGTIPASVVTSASPGAVTYSYLPAAVGSNALAVPVNDGVDITCAGGAFAVGNGTAKVYIRFRALTL